MINPSCLKRDGNGEGASDENDESNNDNSDEMLTTLIT